MKKLILLGSLFLFSCTPKADQPDLAGDLTKTVTEIGSTAKETAETAAELTKKGVETAKDIKKRADTVGAGLGQIKEGLAGE